MHETEKSLYVANVDEIVRQQYCAHEAVKRRERTAEKNRMLRQQNSELVAQVSE